MKKTAIFAGLSAAIILGAAALAGCSSSSTTFSANWYKDTGITTYISGTSEKLTYNVTYTAGTNDDYGISYANGVYATELVNSTYTYDDGQAPEDVYVLTTSLSVDVSYTVGGESATYTDTITSTVKFRTVNKSLQPVYSYKEFSCHSPALSVATTLENSVKYYHYSFETTYNSGLSSATLVYKKLDGDTSSLTDSENTYSISSGYTYLDNEEILFALRGVTISSDSSITVQTLNASRSLIQNVAVSNSGSVENTYNFDMGDGNGATDHSITANKLSIAISGTTQSGTSQTAYYAPADTANAYRAVMLKLESTMPYSLGTISYTLAKAEFTTK